jgi:hypothetical protein
MKQNSPPAGSRVTAPVRTLGAPTGSDTWEQFLTAQTTGTRGATQSSRIQPDKPGL